MLRAGSLLALVALPAASIVPVPNDAPNVSVVWANETFAVREFLGLQYAQGLLCDAAACAPSNESSCQNPGPAMGSPTAACPSPHVFNLTLNLYLPDIAANVSNPQFGPRPALVATHSGGYATGTPLGFGPTWEMDAACKYFAARGWVAISMDYRLTNAQTGGALAPANWSVRAAPLPPGWDGGFRPAPQAIWPAVRDTKAAIRWLRGQSGTGQLAGLELAMDSFVGVGWSAGACTTAFLATQLEADMKNELPSELDPAAASLEPYLDQSSAISAGAVWAGNAVVIDTIDALDTERTGRQVSRYGPASAPLALYRGSEDSVMTPWGQTELQANYNSSGATCDVFGVPGVGHSTLFPNGTVATRNGVPVPPGTPLPVLNHSYTWLATKLGLDVRAL
jgi:acetyl esterase/lipase